MIKNKMDFKVHLIFNLYKAIKSTKKNKNEVIFDE